MKPIRSNGRSWLRSVVITAASAVLIASVSVVVASRYRTRPMYLVGAVVQQNEDSRKQAPLTDVQVAVADDPDSTRTRTDVCIAGPCPFTKIETDNFSRRGRNISVSVLNWSDTTTFMFQAEVFREEVSDIIRETYPVIFGQTFNFSLLAEAEGPSLEAELDGAAITFPLGPTGAVSWAACDIMLGKNRSKSYRCELKPGYAFP